jgi:hypothetical protein
MATQLALAVDGPLGQPRSLELRDRGQGPFSISSEIPLPLQSPPRSNSHR